MIKVVVADDHHLVREGICSILERASDIEVVGQAADGEQTVKLVELLAPDALVVDINMPLMDGLQVVEHVRSGDARAEVIVLSMYGDPSLVRQALRNGARGYVLKSSLPEELALAVRTATNRQTFLSPSISDSVLEGFLDHSDETDSVASRLTRRERQVLQLVGEGFTNKAIAGRLGVSPKTVEKYRANLNLKFGVNNTPSLIKEAIRLRIIFIA